MKKKRWNNLQRVIELFTQKNVTKLSKIFVLDPGSGKKPISDPGSRGQKGTGSRIRNTEKIMQIALPSFIFFLPSLYSITVLPAGGDGPGPARHGPRVLESHQLHVGSHLHNAYSGKIPIP